MNVVSMIGRLTQTPELKQTPNGHNVLNFTVAVDRRGRSGEDRVTDFIDCVAWGKTAEFVSKYFDKGEMIAIIGEIQTRTYEAKDGGKRKAVEINVLQVSFCGSKADKPNTSVAVSDDNLPF